MISLRHKLALGFGGLLAILALMALLTVQQIDRLGNAIDVILKQNYRSVTASQEMKEALEKMDRGLLFALTQEHVADQRAISDNERRFRQALTVELGNITLPGEKEKAEKIAVLFERYIRAYREVADESASVGKRKSTYFTTILPLLTEINALAQEILEMNQANMNDANRSARLMAESARNRIVLAVVACTLVALVFSYQSRLSILKPIGKLIDSANEIREGNLDLVLETGSSDEIGQLSAAFNEMTAALRKVRKLDNETLHRTRLATQEVMNMLPTPIAIFDPEGRVDVATQSAIRNFGLKPGTKADSLDYPWLPALLQRAALEGGVVETDGNGYIQKFISNREFFFRPAAAAIPPPPDSNGVSGTVLLMYDMTQAHEQKELKRGVVSTVSHQLRTPLTSLRMAIHLLLEQRVGTLNAKQAELLNTAGEDSDRLADILDDLLDLNRIESGRSRLNLIPCRPESLVSIGIEPFMAEAAEKKVNLTVDVPTDLPDVTADSASIGHVFANLMANAIRFTPSGGTISVKAEAELSGIRFSVADTGEGIAPEHLKHLFDQFYRVPGQDEKSGIGLGLSIVKEIVTAHGGNVGVESRRGKGSVFHFTLPV